MAEQNNMGYPTISEKAWWIIREKFKASIPSTVSIMSFSLKNRAIKSYQD